jgi:hypothetical protein
LWGWFRKTWRTLRDLKVILKNIKQKITYKNDTVARADKGKTTVIIYSHHYNKTISFLADNKFLILPTDPNKKYQANNFKVQQSNLSVKKTNKIPNPNAYTRL